MKNLSLLFLAMFITGCSVTQTHNINEDGLLSFKHITDVSSEIEEDQRNDPDLEEKLLKTCEDSLKSFSSDILDKNCTATKEGLLTLTGKYKISSNNFNNKDGYIMFNAKEINVAKSKLSGKEYNPVAGDAAKAAKSGAEDIYYFTLPGTPINYSKDIKINAFEVFNEKDYIFVSKIGNNEQNPFKDRMTKQNEENLQTLATFSVLNTTESVVFSENTNLETGETRSEILTQTEHRNKGDLLPSTGNKSSINNIFLKIINFIKELLS